MLVSVLIETYKEILIERESQFHNKNLIFDEDMLSRMDTDINIINNSDINENFIIFEICTYAYILINFFLKSLTRPFDFEILNKINSINKELKKKKYHKKPSSIFDST